MVKSYKNPPSILWAKKHLFSFSYYPIPIIIISYDLREQFLILCDKKAIILVCNVWVNLYVGLCNIDFIKLMAVILVCNVCMNPCVGLCCFPAGLKG